MNILLKNKYFYLSVFFVIIQQILIGLSTYLIGKAGESIVAHPEKVLKYIIFFFSVVALAYILGALSLFFRTKLANDSWKNYYQDIFNKLLIKPNLSSDKNKAKTNTWISGESLSTLSEASFFFVEIIAIYSNVIFTLIALTLVLGVKISFSIFISLITSLILIFILNKPIKNLALQIQNNKLNALQSIHLIWDNIFFGNKIFYNEVKILTEKRVHNFFYSTEKYKALEQIISCIPVFISMPLIIFAMSHEVENKDILLGALVATLPRSLQLFQNIHASSMYTSQLILMKNKLFNLKNFINLLEQNSFLSHVKSENLSIIYIEEDKIIKNIQVNDLLTQILNKNLSQGRFLIKGHNGAGKSSFLKAIKEFDNEAILLGPNIHLGSEELVGSTGQRQVAMIETITNTNTSTLLLDEWDANLDTNNVAKMDRHLSALSRTRLIIEVRHEKLLT